MVMVGGEGGIHGGEGLEGVHARVFFGGSSRRRSEGAVEWGGLEGLELRAEREGREGGPLG